MNHDDIKQRLTNAYEQLEQISKARQQTTDYLRQLDLAEASWKGFIEALSPYVPKDE